MSREVTREVTLPASVEEVWEDLTDPEALADWLGPGAVPATTGASGRVDPGGGPHEVLVEVAVPGRRLAWRWWPEDGSGEASAVEFRLDPVPEGTRLTVVERPAGRPVGFRAALQAA